MILLRQLGWNAATAFLLGTSASFLPAVAAGAEPLNARIEALARQYGFQVEGAALIGSEEDRAARQGESLDTHISRLLADYSFVLIRRPSGGVSHLTILGVRNAPRRAEANHGGKRDITTEKIGAEHYVKAILIGPNGKAVSERLMLDTGASTLVLPRSAATGLGFGSVDLRPVRVQTANGVTTGVTATLASVQVGGRTAQNVEATFVEDAVLGGKKLLGMSFLGRYKLTIDGSAGVIRLQGNGD